MNGTHEVISSFLDDEPFDPQELANALNDPAGRSLLIDLVALRSIVQLSDAAPVWAHGVVQRLWRVAAVAAALCVALGGGYVVGERQDVTTPEEAPAPTRVVVATPFVPAGGIR